MDVVNRLEYQLKKQWAELNKIKDQFEFQKARAEALKTYQTLKRQKQLIGVL